MGGGEIVKKGWLIKSPPMETSGIKSWRKRWFSLRSSKVLEYYKSENGDLKGVINMENCTMVHSSLSHRRYKHVFDIQTKDRTYYLVAATAEEMENWVRTLCQICGFQPTESKDVNSENTAPAPAVNKSRPYSSTLPNSFSKRTSPLPPLPSLDPTPTIHCNPDALRVPNVKVDVPPGTSFTQALAAKGYTLRHQSPSVSSCSSRNSVDCYNSPRLLSEGGAPDPYQTYDVPTNNSPAPPTFGHAHEGQGWYDVPRRSMTESFAHRQADHAQTLSNGYMVPRLLLQQQTIAAYSNYDYPPQRIWATPTNSITPSEEVDLPQQQLQTNSSYSNYDYPPQRNNWDTPTNGVMPLEEARSESIYDVPPPPVPLTNYDHLPLKKPAPTDEPPLSPPLPPRPQDEDDGGTLPLPPRSSSPKDQTDSAHGYVNLRLLGNDDDASEEAPPPIDRTTKPRPPKINGSKKHRPGHKKDILVDVAMETSEKHLSTTSMDTVDEPFTPKDIPRVTSQSIQYCQVTFLRKPVPTPRTKIGGASPPAPPRSKRVNYVDVDLCATQQMEEDIKERKKFEWRDSFQYSSDDDDEDSGESSEEANTERTIAS